MKQFLPGDSRIHRYPRGLVVLLSFIALGLFAGGVFALAEVLFYAVFPRWPPPWGEESPIAVVIAGLATLEFAGLASNLFPAIAVDGHLLVRVCGVKWAVVPWEDVREVVPVDYGWSWKGRGTIWLVVLRRAPSHWHYFFGLSYLRRNVPAFVVSPSLQEYGKVLSTIEGHLQGGDHAA